jgi:preprotein translocase subunit YajC
MENIMTFLPFVLLIVIFYFMLIRPQKKREREVNSMRNSIKAGDEVITIGGICGKIMKTKDDVLTIQVGADKTKFEIMRWAIRDVVSDKQASRRTSSVKDEPAEDISDEAREALTEAEAETEEQDSGRKPLKRLGKKTPEEEAGLED